MIYNIKGNDTIDNSKAEFLSTLYLISLDGMEKIECFVMDEDK